jgi:CDP-diacylglycerol--glycerol-3-phosphate 3-phosphatidyltransferase
MHASDQDLVEKAKMKIKWVNIPNILSALRILTIPVIVFLIIRSTHRNYPVLILVFFFSIILDFFDGYLARKLSQETKLGKILDPLADKLMVSCIVVALVIKTDFPLWLGIVIIGRDILILMASAIIITGRHVVATSILIGKATFALLGVLIMVYIVDLSAYVNLQILKRFFIALTISFLAWSCLEYLLIFRRKKNA